MANPQGNIDELNPLNIADKIVRVPLTLLNKVTPIIIVLCYAYLTWIYGEAVWFGDHSIHEGYQSRNIFLYGLILSSITTLGALSLGIGLFVASSDEQNKTIVDFVEQLKKTVEPIIFSSSLQLLALFTLGNIWGVFNNSEDGNLTPALRSVAAVVTFAVPFLHVQQAAKPRGDNEQLKVSEMAKGTVKPGFASGMLVGTAVVYMIIESGEIETWWFVAGTFLLYTALDLNVFKFKGLLTSITNSVFHVLMIWMATSNFAGDPKQRKLIPVLLLVASAVVSLPSRDAPKTRWISNNPMLVKCARAAHVAVATLALIALEHYAEDVKGKHKVLTAIAYAGAMLKLVSVTIDPTTQTEFLARNGSTLMLLVPFAAWCSSGEDAMRTVAFSFAIVARLVDAVQNMKDSGRGFRSSIEESARALPVGKNSLLSNAKSPLPYLISGGIVVSIVFTSMTLNSSIRPEGKLFHYLVASVSLLGLHGLFALIGVTLGTLHYDQDIPDDEKIGIASITTLEFIRTSVASAALCFMTNVAFQSTAGQDFSHDLFAALITYMFVDIYGRNVV